MNNEKVDLITQLIYYENQIDNKELFIDNWYKARAYAQQNLQDILCRIKKSGTLKITVNSVSPLMCAIIREIILRAHYTDFVEPKNGYPKYNQTVITVLCDKNQIKATEDRLRNTPFLGNYINYAWELRKNPEQDYLDVDIEVVERTLEQTADISDEMVNDISYSKVIDIRKAIEANSIYCIGNDLYNLPDICPEDVEMYEIPLRVFESNTFIKDKNNDWNNLHIKHKLSNVFCTDIFPQRIKSINIKEGQTIMEAVKSQILELSRSEHSRWVAEKLILGFKPWTAQHHYEYSQLFDKDKKEYSIRLKNNDYHLDICSYNNLCRIDPQNRKYDTFLILSCLK